MSNYLYPAFRWNAIQLQCARNRQEDDFIVRRLDRNNLVVAIADGLGGHEHGDRASEVAVNSIAHQVEYQCHRHPDMQLMTALAWYQAFLSCDEDVRQIPSGGFRGAPAATLIAAHLDELGNVSVAGVGDSAIWHLDAAGVRPLLARQGLGFIVDNAIGFGPSVANAIETTVIAMAKGDRLILATDGIETVDPDVLALIFREPLDQAIASLISAIQKAGDTEQDNVTVVMLEFSGAEVE